MVPKPTYKELQQRVRELEQEALEYKCAFARDISERKKAEQALQQAKGELESRIRLQTRELESKTWQVYKRNS